MGGGRAFGGLGEKVERLYREVRAYAIPAGSEEIMLYVDLFHFNSIAGIWVLSKLLKILLL